MCSNARKVKNSTNYLLSALARRTDNPNERKSALALRVDTKKLYTAMLQDTNSFPGVVLNCTRAGACSIQSLDVKAQNMGNYFNVIRERALKAGSRLKAMGGLSVSELVRLRKAKRLTVESTTVSQTLPKSNAVC